MELSIEQIEAMLKDYMGIPKTWDKFDYQTPRYDFNDVVAIVDIVVNNKMQTKEKNNG